MPIVTTRPRPLEWLALASILILAAALRLGAPGIVEFKRDEANLSYLSLDIARGRAFPLLGIDSSVGVRNAPVSLYLMAIPYLATSDPVVATQFVGLLNVIGVGFAYALARRYYGPVAAIVAGLLYAVSPWAVIFSRKIWAQDMLPMFVLLTVGSGLLGFIEGKRWAQLLHLPLLAITGQIHYGAFVLIPVTLYLIIAGRRRLTRAFLFSFALMVVVVLPYAIGAAQAGLLNPGTLRQITAPHGPPNTITVSGLAFQDTALTVAGADIHSLAGPQAFQQYLSSVPNVYPLFYGVFWAVVAASIWLVVRAWRCRDRRASIDVALLIWLWFTPLVFTVTWTPMYTHYLIPMLLAAYLVLGVAAGDLWSRLQIPRSLSMRRVVFGAGGIILLGIVVLQVWLQVALLGFVNDHATPGGFGTPLGYLMPVRAAILAQHPQSLLANLDGQYIGYHEETTIWNFLLYDVPSVRYLDENTEVYPSEPALYLSHQCAAGRSFNLRPSEGCLAISSRAPGDLDLSTFTPINHPVSLANGVHVAAYRWQPDPAGCLSLVWTVDGPQPEDYSFAIHFVNANRDEILNADGLSWRGRYWRAGDTIIRRFCLASGQDRRGEIAGVRIGMYTYEDTPEGRKFYGVDLLDSNGTPVNQMIEIPFNKQARN